MRRIRGLLGADRWIPGPGLSARWHLLLSIERTPIVALHWADVGSIHSIRFPISHYGFSAKPVCPPDILRGHSSGIPDSAPSLTRRRPPSRSGFARTGIESRQTVFLTHLYRGLVQATEQASGNFSPISRQTHCMARTTRRVALDRGGRVGARAGQSPLVDGCAT